MYHKTVHIHQLPLALYNKRHTFPPANLLKKPSHATISRRNIYEIHPIYQKPLKTIKKLSRNLANSTINFLILGEPKREEAHRDAGCFQHRMVAVLLSFPKCCCTRAFSFRDLPKSRYTRVWGFREHRKGCYTRAADFRTIEIMYLRECN